MLLLSINDDSNKLEFCLDNYLIMSTYCNKYNIDLLYHNKIINDLFNKTNNFNTINYTTININMHELLLNMNVIFTKYIKNNNYHNINITLSNYKIIVILMLYYLNNDDYIKYNIFNYSINKIYNFEYICLDLTNNDIINNTRSYVSIDTYFNIYENIIKLISNINTILIINNYIIINSINDDLTSNINDNINNDINIIIKKLISYNKKSNISILYLTPYIKMNTIICAKYLISFNDIFNKYNYLYKHACNQFL